MNLRTLTQFCGGDLYVDTDGPNGIIGAVGVIDHGFVSTSIVCRVGVVGRVEGTTTPFGGFVAM